MKNPAVSIVVPMYNVEKYIETCLNSILAQTFQDFEVIIVDDCSTDRSAEIVQTYKDPRINLFRRIENHGENATRNFGMDLSRGKYVYFMDDDDAILENTLEIFFNAAEEYQSEIVYMDSFYFVKNPDFKYQGNIPIHKGIWGDPKPHMLSKNLIDRMQTDFLHGGTIVTPWIKFQRLDFLRKYQIQFPAVTRLPDVLFNLTELLFTTNARLIDECCYLYRPNPNSVMHENSEKQIINAIESMPAAFKYLEKYFSRVDLPRKLQLELEMHIMKRFFESHIIQSYAGAMNLEKIDDILQSFLTHCTDQNSHRIMINLLAMTILRGANKK